MRQNEGMFDSSALLAVDTAELRNSRTAFFTPDAITSYIADWPVRTSLSTVLEPSAGDAAFLVRAVRRLRELGGDSTGAPQVACVDIHPDSARVARARIEDAGGDPRLTVSDFFPVEPEARYSIVIGNPPFTGYQDFTGESRVRSRAAVLKAGVPLTTTSSPRWFAA
jgi:adenine-specific DNA-methyltransferase